MPALFTPAGEAYRFYNDDGSESAATAAAALNTNLTPSISGDYNIVLRVGASEISGGNGAATDDWAVYVSFNGGSYTLITTSSSVIKGFDSSNLTDGGATTERMSGYTGASFVAGKVSEDGTADNSQLTAGNFIEFLYALTVIYADLSAGTNTIDIKMRLNGADLSAGYNAIPRITITKASSIIRKVTAASGSLVF